MLLKNPLVLLRPYTRDTLLPQGVMRQGIEGLLFSALAVRNVGVAVPHDNAFSNNDRGCHTSKTQHVSEKTCALTKLPAALFALFL